MTFATEYHDWQSPPHNPSLRSCSPNLHLIERELAARWHTMNMGCFGARPIRGSETVPSSHSWGAAIDIGFVPAQYSSSDVQNMIGFLIGWSSELHLSALHDYRGCRIWHAGRTAVADDACSKWWKAQKPSLVTGMGQGWANHLHLEVTPDGWSDASPLVDRGVQ